MFNINCIKIAYEKGYRVVNGILIGPSGRSRKCRINRQGYLNFSLKTVPKSRKEDNVFVHRLAAYQKFGDKIFEEGIEVRHLDGNMLNNNLDNIELGTHSQNMLDVPVCKRETHSVKAAEYLRRFTDKEMEEIRNFYSRCYSYYDTMNKFNISSKGTLYYILHTIYKTKKV